MNQIPPAARVRTSLFLSGTNSTTACPLDGFREIPPRIDSSFHRLNQLVGSPIRAVLLSLFCWAAGSSGRAEATPPPETPTKAEESSPIGRASGRMVVPYVWPEDWRPKEDPITGRIIYPHSRARLKPVEGRAIFKGPSSHVIYTGPNGEWSALRLVPGDYIVKFEAPGFLLQQRSFRIRSGQEHSFDVIMRQAPRRWTARLTTKQIVINRPISFRTNEEEILSETFFILDEVAHILIKNPLIKIRIEGHTDNDGSEVINLKLSQDRADSVKSYLVQKGIDSDRLKANGYGSSNPLFPNTSDRNRWRNRRIAFTILER